MRKRIHWIALVLFIGIISIRLLPHETRHRLILQILIANTASLIIYRIYSTKKPNSSAFSKPIGLLMGFFITAFFSILTYGILYLTTGPVYLNNYLTPSLLLSSLIFSTSTSTFEEFVFRAPLLVILKSKSRSQPFMVLMITVQAILFSAAHYNPYRPIIFCLSALILGLLLGLLTTHLRALWFGIGLHAGLNFVACIANGIRLGNYINLPGALSFDDAGNAIKMTTSAIFPFSAIVIYFFLKYYRVKL